MAMHQGLIAPNSYALTRGLPAGYLQMIDSAFPANTVSLHGSTVTLTYIGGDTVHAWTKAENAAAQKRTPLLWPCWVRSNPGAVNATSDSNACVATLHALGVPQNTNVILDLETAIASGYVSTFDSILQGAGYRTCKYGSSGSIWQNPKTSGGTFVANPGVVSPITIGDCVATQFLFAGSYDLSWVDANINFWGADVPLTAADATLVANAVGNHTVDFTAGANKNVNQILRQMETSLPQIQAAVAAIQAAVAHQLDPAAVATAVVSQLAAQNFTADQIATHILAGMSPTLAAEVVAAMSAALAN